MCGWPPSRGGARAPPPPSSPSEPSSTVSRTRRLFFARRKNFLFIAKNFSQLPTRSSNQERYSSVCWNFNIFMRVLGSMQIQLNLELSKLLAALPVLMTSELIRAAGQLAAHRLEFTHFISNSPKYPPPLYLCQMTTKSYHTNEK